MTKDEIKWYEKTPSTIVLLILFFPAGLVLMWTTAKWSKKTKWVVTGAFAILILLSAITNKSTSQSINTQTVATDSPEQNTPSSKPPQSLEDKIKSQLGDGESISIEQATNLETNQPIPGEKQIDITLNLGSDQWDLNMAKERVWARTATLSQAIFPLDSNIYAIYIVANVPTTDSYGKTQQTELSLVTITRDTYKKVQWDNFDYHNIPTVADSYYENKNIK